jgi:hypothetical protein
MYMGNVRDESRSAIRAAIARVSSTQRNVPRSPSQIGKRGHQQGVWSCIPPDCPPRISPAAIASHSLPEYLKLRTRIT